MDELLIYADRRKLRRYQLGVLGLFPVAVVAGYIAADAVHRVYAGLAVLLAAVTVGGLEYRIRRPEPVLRLSTGGIEGKFGLIAWDDVTGAELLTRLQVHARGVVVRLRPRALLHPATRGFAEASKELYADRLELATSGLELGPGELLREVERYRLYTSPRTG